VTQVGAGGVLGGLQWGSATDGERIYTAVTTEGWKALDPATGAILWHTPLPNAGFALTFGAVTVANGVVYAGSMSLAGENNMFALDAANGDVLFSMDSGGPVGAGASVVDGTVYWGSGYTVLGDPANFNNVLHALEVQ
jgi:polyvinyl alcohol dehydrogenase (cytochrome)